MYPGSPMTTSFHRNKVSTGVLVILMDEDDWYWEELKLPQLKKIELPKLKKIEENVAG